MNRIKMSKKLLKSILKLEKYKLTKKQKKELLGIIENQLMLKIFMFKKLLKKINWNKNFRLIKLD